MRAHSGLVLLILFAAALAGCSESPVGISEGPSSTSMPAPSASSYTITLVGFPATPIPANTTFTFTDHITGDATRTSDHIGAHFGANSTESPSTTAYPSTCRHTPGDLPGDYEVTCTAPVLPGAYFLRGHARIGQGNETVSWWSAEQPFTVA
jgi:hypothetical protein